ncbi:MAG: hypothetical protein A2V66_03695 [Ignavibacteria bacterium RBG_13_36_8]|nr:MAG: hypothetical protein A2V66_03695 [Ignavibacteria bacterium RBG_13_36_8]
MKPRDFVEKYFPYAWQNKIETGVPVETTLAQAALESAWGEKAPGNNFFGIKDSSYENYGCQEIDTVEVSKGKRYKIKDKFETFPTPFECFLAHAKLIKRQWPHVFVHTDPVDFVAAIQNSKKKYATDPKYAEKIKNIVGLIRVAVNNLKEKELLKYRFEAGDIEEKPVELIKEEGETSGGSEIPNNKGAEGQSNVDEDPETDNNKQKEGES